MKLPSDIDISQEKAELREKWKQLTGVYPLPSYPEDNILDLVLYRDLILIGYINERFLSQFLAHAKGDDLDRLAEFYGIKRLPPRPATTLLKFTLSKPTTIPKGTKVASKTGVIFETVEEVSSDTRSPSPLHSGGKRRKRFSVRRNIYSPRPDRGSFESREHHHFHGRSGGRGRREIQRKNKAIY